MPKNWLDTKVINGKKSFHDASEGAEKKFSSILLRNKLPHYHHRNMMVAKACGEAICSTQNRWKIWRASEWQWKRRKFLLSLQAYRATRRVLDEKHRGAKQNHWITLSFVASLSRTHNDEGKRIKRHKRKISKSSRRESALAMRSEKVEQENFVACKANGDTMEKNSLSAKVISLNTLRCEYLHAADFFGDG